MSAAPKIETVEVDLDDSERIVDEVDNLRCDRGKHCAGLLLGDIPQPIGYYLDGDDVGRTAYTFRFSTGGDEYLMCEDCAYEIDHLAPGEVSEPLAFGDIDGFSWNVDISDGKFQAWVWVNGRDHGAIFEQECGQFDTLTDAVSACKAFIHESVKSQPLDSRVARIVHQNEVCVPTGLTGEQLDIVLNPGDTEAPVTVRSMLVDACRLIVAEMVGDLDEDHRLDV